MMKGNSVLQFLAKLDKLVAFFNNFAYCPTLVCLINVQVLINVQGQINVQGGKMLNLDNLVC